ncbi:hypothetical protein pb186bvf_016358 [Paramecium bursaria]
MCSNKQVFYNIFAILTSTIISKSFERTIYILVHRFDAKI